MCRRLNHDGPVCSKCKTGFSPLVYSYDLKCITCTDSHYNWMKFVAAAFIPLTFFCFVVLLFRIDATSPYLYGFITLNQALASPPSLRGMLLTLKKEALLAGRLITILIPFGTLIPLTEYLPWFNDTSDISTGLCHSHLPTPAGHTRSCRVLVWLWRPFHRCCVRFTRAMDIQSSIIKAFATFLLLSYVKLLNATLDILLPVQTKMALVGMSIMMHRTNTSTMIICHMP